MECFSSTTAGVAPGTTIMVVRKQFCRGPKARCGAQVRQRSYPKLIRCDEVDFIGHEALSDAFRHSRASDIDIEVKLSYAGLVRDASRGIDARFLGSGRDEHCRLSDRKKRKVWRGLRASSRTAAGTELELAVPLRTAVELRIGNRPPRSVSGLFFRQAVEQRAALQT
jgi:hypothetical protein